MVLENRPLLDCIIHKLNIKPVIFMNLDSIERFVVLSFTIVYGKCSFFFFIIFIVSPSLNVTSIACL